MNTITYRSDGPLGRTYTDIPLGHNYDVKREPNDIILKRDIAVDLPIAVAIQVRADGSWRWWYTEPKIGMGNPYWHFSNILTDTPAHDCTPAQRQTLDNIQAGKIAIFGMSGSLGKPVIGWAFGEKEARIAAAYHD